MIFSILFLFSVFVLGYILTQRISASFIIGSLLGVTSIFILFFLSKSLNIAFFLYFIGLIIFLFLIDRKNKLRRTIKINKIELVIYSTIFIISFILFDRTFSFDVLNNSFLIQSNLYQDFGSRISNIRYFSSGQGTIPEVPYFAGENLLYHFLYEFYAGIIEFLGSRIDVALNLISALTFTSLLFLIYEFGAWLFKDRIVGVLSSIFFILNSDLSFIQLINKFGTNINAYYHHNTYITGELMGKEFGRNFLNINTFVNQRHLSFALGVFIFVIYYILSKKERITKTNLLFLVLVISLLPFWHIQILIATYIALATLAMLIKNKRKIILQIILFSGVFVLPQLLLIKMNSINELIIRPGFILADNLSIETFSLFWIWNLGLALIFVVVGLFKSNVMQKKVFMSFFALFVIANLFQFGRDIFDNHKFFNAFAIAISMYGAYGISGLFRKTFVYKLIAVTGIFILTISGIFNLIVIKNDVYAIVPDSFDKNFGNWIRINTNSNDIFLTNAEIYDPASLIGARTFLGRPHYVFLFGGDPSVRMTEKNVVLDGKNKKSITSILANNSITYIIIYKDGVAPNLTEVNREFFDNNYSLVYEDNDAIIYKI